MKAKELIYNLRTNFNKVKSSIAEASDQHLLFMLDEARSILAGRKMDQRVNLEFMAQFLDIKPVKADPKIYGDIGEVAVVKLSIPEIAQYSDGVAVFTVGTQDGDVSFSKISFSQIRTALYRKYTAKAPKWFYLDGDIYVINLPMESTGKVRVRGIWAHPQDIFRAEGKIKELTPFDFEYPLSNKDMDTVYKIAMQGDLGWGDEAMSLVNMAKQKRAKQQAADAKAK